MLKYYSEGKANVLLISCWKNMGMFLCAFICSMCSNKTWLSTVFWLTSNPNIPGVMSDRWRRQNSYRKIVLAFFFSEWAAFLIGQKGANILTGAFASPQVVGACAIPFGVSLRGQWQLSLPFWATQRAIRCKKNHRRKGPPFWRRRWSGMEQVLNIVCRRVEWHSQTSQERIYSRSMMQVGTILPSTKHLTSLFTVFFLMLCLCLFIVCEYKYRHMCYGMCVDVRVHLQLLNFTSTLSLFLSTAACSPFENLCD